MNDLYKYLQCYRPKDKPKDIVKSWWKSLVGDRVTRKPEYKNTYWRGVSQGKEIFTVAKIYCVNVSGLCEKEISLKEIPDEFFNFDRFEVVGQKPLSYYLETINV
jgi:hypothetical protein